MVTLRKTTKPAETTRSDSLFRTQALRAQQKQVLGSPSVVLPPSAPIACMLSGLVVGLITVAALTIEIPQTTEALGVVMPTGGLVTIRAFDYGRVLAVDVNVEDAVVEGERLLQFSSVSQSQPVTTNLQSLRRELSHEERAMRSQHAAAAKRLIAFDRRLGAANERLTIANETRQLRQSELVLQQLQAKRYRTLYQRGSVSREDVERFEYSLTDKQVSVHQADMKVAEIVAEKSNIKSMFDDQSAIIEVEQMQHLAAKERLTRQIQTAQQMLASDVVAPRDTVVSMLNVRPGDSVRPGQSLLSLRSVSAASEAWLYVSGRHAGELSVGQRVSLRIDAFPHQIYGVQGAVIKSISAIALRPEEVHAPLQLPEPAFEIRAKLLPKNFGLRNSNTGLRHGLTFRVDIVNGRYPLYRWLLRNVLSERIGADA